MVVYASNSTASVIASVRSLEVIKLDFGAVSGIV